LGKKIRISVRIPGDLGGEEKKNRPSNGKRGSGQTSLPKTRRGRVKKKSRGGRGV